jgi:putative aldouronate transport system permease protein
VSEQPLQIKIKNIPTGSPFASFLHRLKEQKYLQAMAIPGIIWMFIFCYIPMYGIIMAFKDYDIISTIAKAPWAGLTHFSEFFNDDRFSLIIQNTIGISFWKLVIGFPLPIVLALMLNELRTMRFKRTVQTITYLPHFISWVVLGGILMTWFEETGMGTQLLVKFGIISQPTFMFAEPNYFWAMAVVTDVWKELGWGAIIYLAAIAGIDQELYEASIVDGANRFRRMWSITLPCIKPTIAILFILAVSGLMNTNFDQIFVMKNSMNADASDVLDIFVYRMGLQSYRFSYAAAIGLFRSVISLALLLAANALTKKLTDDSLF